MEYTIHDLITKRPASACKMRWHDSTPIGTGITGAMFYGGISAEHIIINRNDFWYGGKDTPVPEISSYMDDMRALRKQGKFAEATDIMYNALLDKKYGTALANMRTLGDVTLRLPCNGIYNGYSRVLHMDTSEAEVTYKIGDSSFKRRYVTSRVRDLIAVELESDEAIEFSLSSGFFRSYETTREAMLLENDKKHSAYRADGDCYIYSSMHEGKFFGIVCRVVTDGFAKVSENGISVSKSRKTLLLIKAFSCEDTREGGENNAVSALKCCPGSYCEVFKENLPTYQRFYNSANISLYDGNVFHSNEELLAITSDTKLNPELTEKLWHFGRYLFISGTAEHGLPFPLYGLWVGGYECRFTHNVGNENVQSIYWHTGAGGFSELNRALINYYCDRMDQFRENARNLYNCNGIFVGTYTTPVNAAVAWYVPVILHFNGVAGWLSQHFYNYYLHTRDEVLFEEKILPFMVEAAAFYEDFHYEDEDGTFVLYPAVSPENSPAEYCERHASRTMYATETPTVEVAILKELLTNLLKEAKVRPQLRDKAEAWQKLLDKLPPYRVNADGAIAEWIPEVHTDLYDHRHISHLYPVFPGSEVNDENNAHLLPHFKKALDLREKGSFCGWSMPHMASVYARFGDRDSVFYYMNALTKVCLLNNFFTLLYDFRDMGITGYDCGDESRTCVQLDALLGFTNIAQEMLMYTSNDLVKILPACPKEYNNGSAKLHFFDGVVEMHWNIAKQECHGIVTAKRDTHFKLALPFDSGKHSLNLKAGEAFEF